MNVDLLAKAALGHRVPEGPRSAEGPQQDHAGASRGGVNHLLAHACQEAKEDGGDDQTQERSKPRYDQAYQDYDREEGEKGVHGILVISPALYDHNYARNAFFSITSETHL